MENKTVWILGKGPQKEILRLPEPTTETLVHWIRVRGDSQGAMFVNTHRSGKDKWLLALV